MCVCVCACYAGGKSLSVRWRDRLSQAEQRCHSNSGRVSIGETCVGTLSMGVCMFMYSVMCVFVCMHSQCTSVSVSLQPFQRESEWFFFCSKERFLSGNVAWRSLSYVVSLPLSAEYIVYKMCICEAPFIYKYNLLCARCVHFNSIIYPSRFSGKFRGKLKTRDLSKNINSCLYSYSDRLGGCLIPQIA